MLEYRRLSQIQGAKTLVLDPSLAGPLGLVTDVSLLKVRRSSMLHHLMLPSDILPIPLFLFFQQSAPSSRQNVLAGTGSAFSTDEQGRLAVLPEKAVYGHHRK
jgi:hypothetical protein